MSNERMRTTSATGRAALLIAALASGAAHAAGGAPTLHTITVDARGPLALVEVTRAIAPVRGETGGSEALLDIALPDDAAMVAVEVQDSGRWRRIGAESRTPGGEHDADLYRSETAARGVTPAVEAFEDGTTHRVRVARAGDASGARAGKASPVLLRYRFAAPPVFSDGRYRLRFPQAPERLPPPADVKLTVADAADVDIAGVHSTLRAGGGAVDGRASARAGWEISWAPRAAAVAAESPTLDARIASAPVSPTETAVAFALRSRPARTVPPPANVLLLVDRSRSVGLPGLSAERDLARRLLESLPPSTRFDVLFFDRESKRLFRMLRPATREALDALEAEMVPDRMQNGTELAAALHEAGALLRRELGSGGGTVAGVGGTLLAVVTDGALPAEQDGAGLEKALGEVPADVQLAAFVVRPADDEPMSPLARRALRTWAASRGGVLRELRIDEVAEGVPAALADLARGGDITAIRLDPEGRARTIVDALGPGAATAGVVVLPGRVQPPALDASARGRRVALRPRASAVAADWLRPWAGARASGARLLVSPALVALLEPVARATGAPAEPVVKGSLDRMVVRNVLSLAYMPRARACYLARSGASPESRDLIGRVRLAIDVVRGEVERASIASSTLNQPDVDRCLRDGAYAVEVPRAMRSDAAVTAILNLVFRPHPPDKRPEVGAVDPQTSEQIDLIIEGARRDRLDGGHD
jgi:hypothetical protein